MRAFQSNQMQFLMRTLVYFRQLDFYLITNRFFDYLKNDVT